MRIKKFTSKSMKEALLAIKQDLGENAIILKTQQVGGKLFSQGEIEVTAAVDEEGTITNQAFSPLRVSDTGVYKRPKASSGIPKPEGPLPMPDAAIPKKDDVINKRRDFLRNMATQDNDLDKKYETLKADITELKQMFGKFLETPEKPSTPILAKPAVYSGDWELLYGKLIEAEVSSEVAREFVDSMISDPTISGTDAISMFVTELNSCFISTRQKPDANAVLPRVIMFVGPTGAGKTTTLAKLAAYHVLNKKKTVSVITADTFRIAAIEQIRTFTDIMNIDLHIVFTPEEAAEAVCRCVKSDIVLVDTAGRSQKSAEHMDDLSAFIGRMAPQEIHLVLSAATKESDLIAIIDKYKQLGVNRLLFTKLDETMKLGNVFTAAIRSKVPFSYFTFGQRVPDDIESAQPHRLVQRLFEGSGK